jgi:type II secretion system protein N
MDIDAVFPSGSLAGRVRTPFGAGEGTLGVSAQMDGLDARVFHPLFSSEFRPKGVLSGSVELDGPSASLREMGGKANIAWENGYVPLPVPLLPIDGIEFTTLRIDSVMEKGLITLQKVELAGDISGTVQGSIRIMEPLPRSRLNLTGELTLPPDIALITGSPRRPASERVRFSLRGTVERPRFRILNR